MAALSNLISKTCGRWKCLAQSHRLLPALSNLINKHGGRLECLAQSHRLAPALSIHNNSGFAALFRRNYVAKQKFDDVMLLCYTLYVRQYRVLFMFNSVL